ncbi:MAG TPA: hypothetical protein VNV37_03560 [Solirubrobacteraceae bacterium]|jgi:hypothetical protein|nr:hypothetical protein [Solirubrobacteraceae bacterium]
MLKSKLVSLGVLVAFVFGATAASASAASPEWWVAGKVIAKEEPLNEATNAKRFVISNTEAEIVCSGLKVKKGFIKSKTENGAEALLFTGCEATAGELSKCKVQNSGGKIEGTIETAPIKFQLENPKEEKEDNKLEFRPKSGESFATIDGSCLPKKEATLGGGMNCNYPSVETEANEHRLEFSSTSGSTITLAGKSASFIGEVDVTLKSKKLWSVKFM